MGEVTSCSVCGGTDLTVILDMGEQPLAERFDHPKTYPLALAECGRCTLVQLTWAVDQAEVFPPDHPYRTGNTRALVEHFTGLAGRVAPYLDDGDLIVDIGANDCTFLSLVRDTVRRVGVEPTNQYKKCADPGIQVWHDYWTSEAGNGIGAFYGPAKVVTACNVLAHVPDCHDFVKGVTGLLDDDGVFVTENHDLGSVVDGLQIDTVYSEHLRYFNIASLSRLLGAHGLTVFDVERIPTHGGSFRVFARKFPTEALAGRAWKAKTDLWHLLAGLTADGSAVYGVGAGTRATPLIHYAGIARFLHCIVEVPDSEKIGRMLPGTAVPIVDEVRLIEDQPPYALLLSHQWTASITKSLRAKGYAGKFILPLPEARVIDG